MLAPLWAPLRAPAPRRRGGWRQRLANEELNGSGRDLQAPRISRLFGNHMLSLCEGIISASRLQALAVAGVADGFQHPMLTRLAELREGQHAQVSLINLLQTCDVPQQLSHFPGEFVTHAILPSTWIRILHGLPPEFRMRLGAERGKLRSFWQQFLSRPCNHDVRDNRPIVSGMDRFSGDSHTLHPACGRWSVFEDDCLLCGQLRLAARHRRRQINKVCLCVLRAACRRQG